MNKYKQVKQLGKGGNGVVWKVTDGIGFFAKKTIIKYKNKIAYKRFIDEITIIRNTSHDGIIQIIDFFIPTRTNIKTTPYYIMPIGVTMKDYLLKGISLNTRFDIIITLIDTVKYLHTNNITHRDIKIENILMIDDNPKLSDFGLANFPKKERISKYNEKIGPGFTIAPEMKRISSSAEYKKADVYSLAKTIWVILTQSWMSFDGQYSSSSSIGLANYLDVKINEMTTYGETEYRSLVILEKLLQDSTHNDPTNRPDITEFNSRFEFWLNSNNDYFLRNGIEWRDAIERIFPVSVPQSCVWTNINLIYLILDILFSNYDQLNHSFFPISGGEDFTNVQIIRINNTDYLMINRSYILKPKKLIFEYMNDFEWSYFRLELETLNPFFGSEVFDKEEHIYINQTFEIIENKTYFKQDDSHLDFKPASIYLEGSILIVQKTARINGLHGKLDHYSGLHNKMTNTEYKDLLIKIKNFYKKYI